MFNHPLWGLAFRPGVQQSTGPALILYVLATQGLAAAAKAAGATAAAPTAAAPGAMYQTTQAIEDLNKDQHEAVLLDLSALITSSIAEQQQSGQSHSHIQIAKLMDICNWQKPELAGLLGLFENWVAYLLRYPAIFRLSRIVPGSGCALWDPVDRSTKASVEEEVEDRQLRRHLVTLTGEAGEHLLWSTVHGQKLAVELRGRVVEVVKQRGLWVEGEGKQQRQGQEVKEKKGQPEGLSLEEILSMVPKEMEHCIKVRPATG